MEPEGQGRGLLSSVALPFVMAHELQHLSSAEFKEKMSHVVKDLAGSGAGLSG